MNKRLEKGCPFDELDTNSGQRSFDWKPSVGELVQYLNQETWYDGEYIGFKAGISLPHAIYSEMHRSIIVAKHIRQIPPKVVIHRRDIADMMGCKVEDLEIIE